MEIEVQMKTEKGNSEIRSAEFAVFFFSISSFSPQSRKHK